MAEDRIVELRFELGNLGDIGTATARIEGLEDSADRARGAIAKYVSAAAAVAGLSAIVSRSVAEAQEAQAALAQLAATVQSTGAAAGFGVSELEAYSKQLANLSNFSTEAVQGGLSRILTYTAIQGPMFKEAAQAALDMSQAIGIDLSQAAEKVGNALNYPTEAISSLTRQGFRFTDEQKKLIKSFQDSGQIAKAQAIILGELKLAYEGSAAAARNTLGGALAALSKTVDDVFEAIGNRLSPTLVELADDLRKAAESGEFDGIADAIADNLIPVIKALGVALQGAGELAKFMAEHADAIRNALVLLMALRAANWIYELGKSLGSAILKAGGLAQSINSLAYVTPLAAKGLNALGVTAGQATIALGGVGIVLAGLAIAMQSYIGQVGAAYEVQQRELANAAHVKNYLDELAKRKDKLTQLEYGYAKAIQTRVAADLAAAQSAAASAQRRLASAEQVARARAAVGGRSDEAVAREVNRDEIVKELRQEYADASGNARALAEDQKRLEEAIARVGVEAVESAGSVAGLSKQQDRARESARQMVEELQRAAEWARRGALAATLGEQAERANERLKSISDEVAKVRQTLEEAGLSLPAGMRATIEAAAAAVFDFGEATEDARARSERLRAASEELQRAHAALADQISGTAGASRALEARLAAEESARGTSQAGVESFIAALAAENLARAQELDAIEASIRASQREGEFNLQIAQLAAQVADAKTGLASATLAVEAAVEIENRRIAESVALFSDEWQAIARDVEAKRARIAALTAEAAAEERLRAFRQRVATVQARIEDWKQQAEATRLYGAEIANLLGRFGLLSDATRELEIKERALEAARAEGINTATEAGRARLAVLEAEQRGYADQLDALSRVQVTNELLGDSLEPLRDAWESLGSQVTGILADWAATGKLDFENLAESFKKSMVAAILEVLKRWILAEQVKRAEAVKTAAISKAAQQSGNYGPTQSGGNIDGGILSSGSTSTGAAAGAGAAALGTVAVFAAIYFGVKAWISSNRKEWGELTIGAGGFGVTNTAGAKKSVAALTKALEGFLSSAREIIKGFGGAFESLERDITLGRTGQGKSTNYYVRLAGGVVENFGKDAQAAMEFALVQAVKNSKSRGLSPLVKEAIQNSLARTVDAFQKEIATFTEISNLGASDAELQVQNTVLRLDELWQELVKLGSASPAAVQGFRDLGAAFIESFQSWSDSITGRQRSAEEQLQIRKIEAAVYNARKAEQLAKIALDILAARAALAAYEATAHLVGREGGGRPGGGNGRSNGQSGGLLGLASAMLYTAQASAVAAGVMTASGDAQLDALRAQLAALEELHRALGAIPDINPDDLRPIGRGGGGGSGQTVEQWLRDRRKGLLPDLLRQLRDLDDTYNEQIKSHRLTAEQLKKLNELREEERKRIIAAARQALRRETRDFIRPKSALELALREIDDTSLDLRKRWKEMAAAGVITAEQFRQMIADLNAATDARRREALTSAGQGLLLELYDVLGKEEEAAQLRWQLSLADYKLRLKIFEQELIKYGLLDEGNKKLLDTARDLLGEFERRGPVTGGAGAGGSTTHQTAQQLYAERLAQAQEDAARAQEQAAERMRRAAESLLDLNRSLADERYNPATARERFDAQYQELMQTIAAARGGDVSALERLRDLEGPFLELARQLGGTTNIAGGTGQTYQQLYAFLRTLNEQLAAQFGGIVGGVLPPTGAPPVPGTLPPPGGGAGAGGGGTAITYTTFQQTQAITLSLADVRRAVEGTGAATVSAIQQLGTKIDQLRGSGFR